MADVLATIINLAPSFDILVLFFLATSKPSRMGVAFA